MKFDMKEIFLALAGGLVAVAGWAISGALSTFFSRMEKSFDRMTESVENLNLRVAVVIERIENHDKRLERLERENAGQ